MNEAYQTSNRMTSKDMTSTTSSRGSAAGPSRSGLPDGPKIGPSGQVAAPASPSAARGNAKETVMSGTSGLSGSSLSEFADRMSLLANRLRQLLPWAGSTEYSMTWKRKVTPHGRVYYQLAASGRRTSGADCSGLRDCLLAGWRSPTATDGTNGGPNARDRAGNPHLSMEAQLAGWATASSRDWKDTPGMSATGTNPDGSERERLDQLPRQVTGLMPSPSSAGTEKPAGSLRLNPAFSGWLMGYPREWILAGLRAHFHLRGKSKGA